jgi:stalled ribosome rescue protein Dom34
LKTKRGYRRGYPVAILIGLEENHAVLWKVFSKVVKPDKTINLSGARNDPKATYNFHESIINASRPTLKEGVRSLILASPPRTDYAQKFTDHIRRHHAWLNQGPNRAAISEMAGSAGTMSEVASLVRTPLFRRQISETTIEETENLIQILEERLTTSNQHATTAYSLEEAENLIIRPQRQSQPKPDYLMLTDKYLANSQAKNRLHRLIQIAANRNVKTRIVPAESPAGKRITQLGGLVCLAQEEQTKG